MRLFSGAPYWLVANGIDPWPIGEPRNADVIVIGAGLAGATVADSLALAGFNVTVLDRREPGAGSTAANTGIVTYELDVELGALAKQIGEPFAVRSYRACAEAVVTLETLVSTLGDDCGFKRCTSLYLAHHRRHMRRVVREAAIRNAHDLLVDVLSEDDVRNRFGMTCHGALLTRRAARVDPFRLTRALLARASAAGTIVCPRTTALSWRASEREVCVETNRGTVTADWLILATGYETPSELRNDLVALHSTYAFVTFPVDKPAFADDLVVWDTNSPYLYVRAANDGRVVVGGCDVPFRDAAWRDHLMPSRTRTLEKEFASIAPAVELDPEFIWSGTFGETRDGLPCIGPVPGMPRVLAALGYGGNGIVFSVIASRILRDIILGKGHEDAELFSLDRDQNARRS